MLSYGKFPRFGESAEVLLLNELLTYGAELATVARNGPGKDLARNVLHATVKNWSRPRVPRQSTCGTSRAPAGGDVIQFLAMVIGQDGCS